MKQTLRYAFLKTIPVLLGYVFLGLAFGLLLQKSGYSFWWALLASTVIYAGSIQFVLISFLSGGMLDAKSHKPALIGLCSAVLCLLIFGGNQFILPSLILTVTLLLAMQKTIEKEVPEA